MSRATIDHARELAARAHAGQKDAQGRDYVVAHLAPIASGCAVFSPQAEAAGWLHDIVEDTAVHADVLLTEGIDPEVVSAVESVTKRDGEPYDDLITRAVQHPLGRFVKLVDNAWNIACAPSLATSDPVRARRMLDEKYLPARRRLLDACGLTQESDEYRSVLRAFEPYQRLLEPQGPEAGGA